jgi:hypothetical protein
MEGHLHGLYARIARRCPVFLQGASMGQTHRLYSCARCAVQVRICRSCDRGNIYCAGPCAGVRRGESLRRAGVRYQLSRRGAGRHAARQALWRTRLADKVTHQGSVLGIVAGTLLGLLTARSTKPDVHYSMQVPLLPSQCQAQAHCSFCGAALSVFSRLGWLRGGR